MIETKQKMEDDSSQIRQLNIQSTPHTTLSKIDINNNENEIETLKQIKSELSQERQNIDDIIITPMILSTPPYSRSSSNIRGRTSSVSSTRSRSTSNSRASSPRPKNYICNFPGCSKAYSRPSLLDQHIQTHYGYRPFKCEYSNCGESFTRKDHLERHRLKHLNNEDKPFHCQICNKGVNTKQHLKRHEKTHFKSFVCDYDGCNESFYKHQSLKAHIRAVHEGNNGHNCKICGKHFERPNRLISHMEKHHSDSSKLMCDFPGCYKTFRVWSALQLHIKTDHPRLECEICGKKCVGSNGLSNHMKIHDEKTVIKLWKCHQCGDKFHKKEDAVHHFAEKHPLLELPEELHYAVKEEKEKNCSGKHKRDTDDLNLKINDNQNVEEHIVNQKNNVHKSSEGIEMLDDYGFIVSTPTRNTFKRQQANRIPSSPDVMNLLVDNVDLRLECPYSNCQRLFKRDYDLQRHLEWHERQDENLSEKVDSILSEYEYNENGELIKITDKNQL